MKCYRIRHEVTGLYSKGGQDVDEHGTGYYWSPRGKVWNSKQAVSSHLRHYFKRLYVEGKREYHNQIPMTWLLIEYDMVTGERTQSRAHDLKPEIIYS